MNKTPDTPAPVEAKEKPDNPDLTRLHEQIGPSPEQLLPKMEMNQFLEQSQQHRLYLLTGNTNVAEGKSLTVDFHKNAALEREITAGHILPPEVRKITIDGIEGARNGLNGEFYANNGKGERLKIFTGTEIMINKLSSEEALQTMRQSIDKQTSTFSEDEQPIARTALERGIDPILVVNTQESLGSGYESLEDEQRAEMLATIVARKQGEFQMYFPDLEVKDSESGKYSPEFVGYILPDTKSIKTVGDKMGLDSNQMQQAEEFQSNFQERKWGYSTELINSDPMAALKNEIASTEGDYESYNRGRAGVRGKRLEQPLSQMTIGEIMQHQNLPEGHPERLFACGKYQIIPKTFRSAVAFAQLSLDDIFSPENQEKMFPYLISHEKRPNLYAYLNGHSNSIYGAQMDLAMEFASIPQPNGLGYYDGDSAGNKAEGGSGRAQRVAQILKSLRSQKTTESKQSIS